ncbi:MAG: glucose-6-phosphate isomerase [Verrucomicrobiota bacterium]
MNWNRLNQYYLHLPSLDFSLDISRISFPEAFLEDHEDAAQKAFAEMKELEGGAIANPDENRQVGHYWLRKADLAPDEETSQSIRETLARIHSFADAVHGGKIVGAGGPFENLLVIGIGGSALGPQFVAAALGNGKEDKLKPYFFDNTDPDGIDNTLASLEGKLDRTLAIVISKSGGTPETRNGMLEAENAWKNAGLDFSQHAVAVTGEGSKLDGHAEGAGWLSRFPMWDWVGGRTSETGPVGLLPAVLQGIDIDGLLSGAAQMDEATRTQDTMQNPAALLALMWLHETNGKGEKDMVVLPYKDRLSLFSKYLQQLVMESLGKEKDLEGNTVHQGIAVYGNKGSTDQHAYVQQLRDGVPNFFAVFIQVLKARESESITVDDGATAGDFLHGFYLGTREALSENGRGSVSISIGEVTPASVGMLIALFERAVGFYASFVGINAYHQPGVEAGKKAAASVLNVQRKVVEILQADQNSWKTVEEIASTAGLSGQEEWVFKVLEQLAVNRPEFEMESKTTRPDNRKFRAVV